MEKRACVLKKLGEAVVAMMEEVVLPGRLRGEGRRFTSGRARQRRRYGRVPSPGFRGWRHLWCLRLFALASVLKTLTFALSAVWLRGLG